MAATILSALPHRVLFRGGWRSRKFVQKGTNPIAENSMPQDQDANWGSLAGVGLQIGVGVGLGCVVGWWLDKKFGWSPWGIVVGAMLGLASGMYLMIKETLKKQG